MADPAVLAAQAVGNIIAAAPVAGMAKAIWDMERWGIWNMARVAGTIAASAAVLPTGAA